MQVVLLELDGSKQITYYIKSTTSTQKKNKTNETKNTNKTYMV